MLNKSRSRKEIPFSLLAAIVLGLMANNRLIDKNSASLVTRIDGLVLLAFFTIFLYYSFSIAKAIEGMDEHVPVKTLGLAKSSMLVIVGLIGLTLGGKWIVDGAVAIAKNIGMSESLVGLTVVAVGTSLPELATSSVAAYKKMSKLRWEMWSGLIFSIFFCVLGISATIKPLTFQFENNHDIGVVIFLSMLLFLFMFTGKKRSLDRWEGLIFLTCYGVFVAYLVFTD